MLNVDLLLAKVLINDKSWISPLLLYLPKASFLVQISEKWYDEGSLIRTSFYLLFRIFSTSEHVISENLSIFSTSTPTFPILIATTTIEFVCDKLI